ncbi:MAG TPA: hypothetical protein VIW24_18115 [Aldersonia sp.]
MYTLELTDAERSSFERSLLRQQRIDEQCFGALSADEKRELIDSSIVSADERRNGGVDELP